jgi:hypothetical protein
MATALVALTLFVGVPILIGHIIYFGSKDEEPGAPTSRSGLKHAHLDRFSPQRLARLTLSAFLRLG